MASDSYPRPGNNSGIVTELNYERLAAPQTPDGLIGSPTDPALVFADGVGTRTVRVRAGRFALVRGFMYNSGPDDIPIQLPGNTSGSTRVDLIVLRLTRSTWRVQEAYIQGTPGLGQPAPVWQTNTGVWDLPVAAVTVIHNAGSLTADRVTPVGWYLGSDGQILCTSTTRPPHERGRRIHETTGRSYESNGTQWLSVADDATSSLSMASSNWVAPSYNIIRRRNGWSMFNVVPRRVSGNFGAGTTSTLGTIPAGFRPVVDIESVGYAPSSGAVVSLRLESGGQVTMSFFGAGLETNRYVNLPTVTYPVA